MRHKLLGLSGAAFLLGACSGEELIHENPSALKANLPYQIGNSEPVLGNGFDSLSQKLIDTSLCVGGEQRELQSTQVVTDMTQTLNKREVVSEFTGEVKGTPRLAFVNVDTSSGVFSALNAGDYNHSIVYSSKVVTGGSKLLNAKITDDFSLLEGPAFLNRCGDEYVSQITTGGRLTVVLNFVFSSSNDRNKKQLLGNISGPWVKVQSDILNKVETDQIEGTLEVKFQQDGGDLSKANIEGAVCSLNSKEEVEQCLEAVTEMIRYADSDFVANVSEKPAILEYVTSPVTRLNFTGTAPTLPADVLEHRRLLKADLDRYVSAKNSLEQGLSNGLNVNSYLLPIRQRIDVIKQTAATCYDYAFSSNGPDWSNCHQAMDVYKEKRKSDELVEIGRVKANEPLSYHIFNPYKNAMKVEVLVETGDLWKVDGKGEVNYEGLSAKCSTKCPTETAPKARLLMLDGGSYESVPAKTNLTIEPGEAVYFTVNDELNGFKDNSGSITLYWKCLNCNSSWPQMSYESFTVSAKDKEESAFKASGNHDYKLFAAGLWSPGSGWLSSSPWFGPEGDSASCENCYAEYETLGTLIYRGEDVLYENGYRGPETLSLKQGQRIFFGFNDKADSYNNNEGSVTVYLSCLDCELVAE